jgi:hypothetical protein
MANRQFDLFEDSEIFYITSAAISRDFSPGMRLVDHMRAGKYKTLWILQRDKHEIRVFNFEDDGGSDGWNWRNMPPIPSRFYKHLTWYS